MADILTRDSALLELLVRKYGADTLKREIKAYKNKKTINDGKQRN